MKGFDIMKGKDNDMLIKGKDMKGGFDKGKQNPPPPAPGISSSSSSSSSASASGAVVP